MSETHLSPDQVVENDRHQRHDPHTGDAGDGRDDASFLFESSETSVSDGEATLSSEDNPHELIEAALIRLKEDVGVIAEDPVVRAFAVLRATDMPAYLRLRQAVKHTNRDCSVTLLDKLVRETLPASDDDTSALDELVTIARAQCQLHHDADRNAVAVIPMPSRREVWRVYSTGFEEWLRAVYWRAREAGIAETTMKSALATLAAAGVNDGDEIALHLRAAQHETGYLIDLADERWRVVHVTPSGWQVLDQSPVYFTRTQPMRPLPIPERGSDIELLWQHVNIPTDRRMLVLSWLLDGFRPDTPFPVLELVGEQGSAKSTTQSVLRSLVDPNKVLLRGRPKTVEDIFVAAANNWLVSYENLSGLTAEQQDAFCTLATGGGFASRQLYTNGEEHVMETKRPVVLNGIAVVATRPDLIDRVIHVDLPTIPSEARRDDADTHDAWERDRPQIFGALLDLFVEALRWLPSVKLTHKQRMADYERLGEAVAGASGPDRANSNASTPSWCAPASTGCWRATPSRRCSKVLREPDQPMGLARHRRPALRPAQHPDHPGSQHLAQIAQGAVGPAAPHCPGLPRQGHRDQPPWPPPRGCHLAHRADIRPPRFRPTPPGVSHSPVGGLRYGEHRE